MLFKKSLKMAAQCFWPHVFPSSGYQLYKRYRKPGSDDADSDSLALEAGDGESAKKNIHAVENGGFEFDDISKSEEKHRDVKNATQLWV